jgi:hypothetical protein
MLLGVTLGCGKAREPEATPRMGTGRKHLHDAPRPDVRGVGQWATYADPEGALRCTFQVPENWAGGASRAAATAAERQAIWLGPSHPESRYHASLTVRRIERGAAGERSESLERLRDARRRQYAAAEGFTERPPQPRTAGGASGWQQEFSYVLPLPAESLASTPTRVATRLVQVAHGDALYEFLYTADARDAAAFRYVFDHLLESLAFAPSLPSP